MPLKDSQIITVFIKAVLPLALNEKKKKKQSKMYWKEEKEVFQ